MVKSSNGNEMRSFTIVEVHDNKGNKVSFNNVRGTDRLINRGPAGAARKAHYGLCNYKKLKGKCVFYIKVKEITQNSLNKEYEYKTRTYKYDEPVIVGDRTYEYGVSIKSLKGSFNASKIKKTNKANNNVVSKTSINKTKKKKTTTKTKKK